MSQIVTCPDCGHIFESDEPFEKYEKIIEKLTGGTRSVKGQESIDVIGLDGTTYQVKYAKSRKGMSGWQWDITSNHMKADFFALFGIIKRDEFIFLLPYEVIIKKSKLRPGNDEHHDMYLSAGHSFKHWIWDYSVSPKNFMARVNELKEIQQLSLQFTQGLGD